MAELRFDWPASSNNYSSPDPEYGYSYNGLAKLTTRSTIRTPCPSTISCEDRETRLRQLGVRRYLKAASELKYYYEVAPIHVSNYAVVWNSTISPSWSNQVLAGVNYFRQIFSDFNNGFVVSQYGLNLAPNFDASGLTGAPNIQVGGFDGVGQTPPEGREDITGHLTDVVSHTFGKHQVRFGGEFRRAQLEEFYHRHGLGNLKFDGSQGPWADSALIDDSRVKALADFMAGYLNLNTSVSPWATDAIGLRENLQLFAQDSWQVNRKLTLNYGLRWDY